MFPAASAACEHAPFATFASRNRLRSSSCCRLSASAACDQASCTLSRSHSSSAWLFSTIVGSICLPADFASRVRARSSRCCCLSASAACDHASCSLCPPASLSGPSLSHSESVSSGRTRIPSRESIHLLFRTIVKTKLATHWSALPARARAVSCCAESLQLCTNLANSRAQMATGSGSTAKQ